MVRKLIKYDQFGESGVEKMGRTKTGGTGIVETGIVKTKAEDILELFIRWRHPKRKHFAELLKNFEKGRPSLQFHPMDNISRAHIGNAQAAVCETIVQLMDDAEFLMHEILKLDDRVKELEARYEQEP